MIYIYAVYILTNKCSSWFVLKVWIDSWEKMNHDFHMIVATATITKQNVQRYSCDRMKTTFYRYYSIYHAILSLSNKTVTTVMKKHKRHYKKLDYWIMQLKSFRWFSQHGACWGLENDSHGATWTDADKDLKLNSRLLRLLKRLSSKLCKPTPKQAQKPITTVEHVTGNQAREKPRGQVVHWLWSHISLVEYTWVTRAVLSQP